MNVNVKNSFSSIEQMANQVAKNKPKSAVLNQSNINNSSFGEILKSKQKEEITGTLRFSKHVNQRLASRNIDLSASQLERLESATNKAREKGIKESLVMVDDLAFIVNVPSKTVITAINNMEESVFTNIDGAVIS